MRPHGATCWSGVSGQVGAAWKSGAAPALDTAVKAAQGKPVPATGKVPIQGLSTAEAKAILAGTKKAPAGLNTQELLKAAQAGC